MGQKVHELAFNDVRFTPKADMAQHEFVMAFVDSNISVVNSRMERLVGISFAKSVPRNSVK
jgi:hypothetical protein